MSLLVRLALMSLIWTLGKRRSLRYAVAFSTQQHLTTGLSGSGARARDSCIKTACSRSTTSLLKYKQQDYFSQQSTRKFLEPSRWRLYSTSSSSLTAATELDDDSDDVSSNYDYDNDTIFALSSGSSMGQATAVAVIRISGPLAGPVLQSLCSTTKSLPKPRMAALRELHHPITGVPLDQALVLWFPAPNSFTGQDIVELHCHGSRAVVESILQVLAEWKMTSTRSTDTTSTSSTSNTSIRLAEPGEFTKRAWQSGKLNLLQVEALADLLVADTSTQRVQALRQLRTTTQNNVFEQWRRQLIAGLAHAEAVIDFGDDENLGDEDEENTISNNDAAQWTIWGNVRAQMQDLCHSMERHLYHDGRRGELVRDGVRIAIVGPPNAGKSSLLNLLAQREAAIVSPMAGTTRDVVEVAMNLGGVKCLVQDTAGLRRHTQDVIEQKGMERATQVAAEADMVLVLMDGSRAAASSSDVESDAAYEGSADDYEEMNWLMQSVLPNILNKSEETASSSNSDKDSLEPRSQGPDVMLVINKSDLPGVNGEKPASSVTRSVLDCLDQQFEISCVTQAGVDSFLESLTSKVVALVSAPSDAEESSTQVRGGESGNLITRTRHRQHVQAAVEALQRFHDLSGQGTYAVDLAAEEMRLAASELGRVTGAVDVEDVLDKLFADFCIGK